MSTPCSAGATNLNAAMDSVAGVLPGAFVIAPLLTGGDCPTMVNKCMKTQLKQEVTTCFTRVGVVTRLLKKEEDKK